MTRASVKQDERSSAQALLVQLHMEQAALVDREAPDFEVSLDGVRHGLEVVELADPRLARGTNLVGLLREAIAERLAEEKDLNLWVHLSLTEGSSTAFQDRVTRKQHVEAIVALARAHKDGESTLGGETLAAAGAPGVRELSLRSIDGLELTIGTQGMGRGHPFVQACIDAKNEKIDDYRRALPGCEIWLLLRGRSLQRSNVWRAVVEGRVFKSSFDRTFFLHDADGFHELETSP